jgi:D-alanyl-D-alanine carboxypeptidase
MRHPRASVAVLAVTLVATGGCGGSGTPQPPAAAPSPTPTAAPSAPAAPSPTATTAPARTTGPAAPATGATAAPSWLGTRVLPTDSAGFGIATATPPELVDRRIVTVDELPPPADGAFHARVRPVPPAVAARSTWSARCPVTLAELRYLTVGFRGFDGRAHTGELLVHRDAAADLVTVFGRLFAAGYPIERMRVTTVAERDAPPTGDGNTTGAFNCRPSVGATRWSEHAYGRAVDVNPFQNPYVKGRLVLPELAVAYTDRGRVLPGVITATGPVVAAFRAVGWTWGGSWRSPKDYMHFSATGR